MRKSSKKRALRGAYTSQNQLTLEGFTSPFHEQLYPNNCWVQLAKVNPWTELVGLYLHKNAQKTTGRPSLNPRVVIGAMIIKHFCAFDDRETVAQITRTYACSTFGVQQLQPRTAF